VFFYTAVLFCVSILIFTHLATSNKFIAAMNWKDLLLVFLVVVAASLAYDKGVKPLLEPKKPANKAE
jgi:hypothetical protein